LKTAGMTLGLGLSLLPLVCAAQPAPIADPAPFVAEVYRHFAASERGPGYLPPEDIYTPRLKALFAEDDRRRRGEVGCIDFVFWVNGQDWEIKNIRVTARDVAGRPDRKLVIATFLNIKSPEEIHFDFQLIAGHWLLDDVHSLKAGRAWTLSEILRRCLR
jgi:hypothetical protein